jgi:hypothetical protein
MYFYERLEDTPKSADETINTSSSSIQIDVKNEKAFRYSYCRALMRLTNRLTFVLDRIENGLMLQQIHTLETMMPRAVHLLNIIGARVKHAKIAANQAADALQS